MKNLNKEKTYRTADLALAVAISLFQPIYLVEKGEAGRAHFVFKDDGKINKLIENYWQGKLMVEPQSYFSALRSIKTRIYE